MERQPPRDGVLRAFRDRYVARFVGVSYDLAPRAVGIHPDLLGAVPELAGRTVLVSHDHGRAAPLSRRPAFLVVPLDSPLMRNAREMSARGGVVFSSFDLDDPDSGRLLQALGVGESLYLNASVDRLPDASVRRPYGDGSAA